jgi:hypothetical protein
MEAGAKTILSINFIDPEFNEETFLTVRSSSDVVLLALSKKSDGDIEVALDAVTCQKLIESLQAALGPTPDAKRRTYAHSVSFRLQRTTTESAFVNVPILADLMIEQPDGTGRIDVEKMVARALEMGQAADVSWQRESKQVQPHPVQMPPPGLH